jgi:hypothetical protein
MTREDVLFMAQECHLIGMRPHLDGIYQESLERFAALVAAAAKAEEREAIAQIIEDAPPLVDYAINERGGCLVCGFTPKLASEFIRARGETK